MLIRSSGPLPVASKRHQERHSNDLTLRPPQAGFRTASVLVCNKSLSPRRLVYHSLYWQTVSYMRQFPCQPCVRRPSLIWEQNVGTSPGRNGRINLEDSLSHNSIPQHLLFSLLFSLVVSHVYSIATPVRCEDSWIISVWWARLMTAPVSWIGDGIHIKP